MFTPIQNLIPNAARSIGISREVEAALVCEKYRKLAPTFVHEKALRHTFPQHFQNRRLVISVDHPAWAEIVIKNKKELIAELNKSLGHEVIVDIRTQLLEEPTPS